VGQTVVIYVTFLPDVARQKLLKLANISRSYSKNNTGAVFLRHSVVLINCMYVFKHVCVIVFAGNKTKESWIMI